MLDWLRAVPFALVLAGFAVLPGIAPRFWHRRMALLSFGFVGLGLVIESFAVGLLPAVQALWQVSVAEFMPFIFLLLALYALGGGIMITGGPWGRPAGNLLLLLVGAVLASVMGTIGASLLLIHPLLAANGHRYEKRHLVLAFIILVGNAGGALSPLGDPPLLVGFLKGVPFFWPLLNLWAPFLLLAVPVLALSFGLDVYYARRESRPARKRLRVRGVLNIVLLLLLTLGILIEGVWHPGVVHAFSAVMPGEQLALAMLAGICVALSEGFTRRAIRAHNRFAWAPMKEIIILFFAIYATIGPVFALLAGAHLAKDPILWFWASGIASAILDAAPTYLIFFQAAGGHAASLAAPPATLLAALAAGSVFFGPVTYLGNAPNLMIREIAARRGVRMPGFFVYAGIMCVVLVPVYLVMGWVFY